MPTPCDKYLKTLLIYYEEEVAGEAYFYGLAEHFEEQKQLVLLAEVEQCAANSIINLLDKYQLEPRSKETLVAEGKSHVERHATMSWKDFMAYITQRYPDYLDDFTALENMAPTEDLPELKQLTAHEIAAIEFAKLELTGSPNSLRPLYQYIQRACLSRK